MISNCIFRSGSEIKFAVFRSDFSGVNFDTDTNIQNLELLYDSDHQVNIYNHKGKVTISCDVCSSPVRGEIKMWSGTVSDIPEGWHICDGTEGTPDLTDRFMIAGTSTGPTDVRPLNELKNGILIYGGSGYRSYSHQTSLYNNYVAKDGFDNAERYSARPGYSEHQLGLAMDILNKNWQFISKNDEEYTWLVNNSYKYGFILRYPEGKENITGYMYEEWHFRYFGLELAKELYDKKLIYEEYLAMK